MASLRAFVPLAIALHAATLYAFARLPPPPAGLRARTQEILFDLDEPLPDEPLDRSITRNGDSSLRAPRSARSPTSSNVASVAPLGPTEQVEPSLEAPTIPTAEATNGEPPVAEGGQEQGQEPRRTVNLGLGDPSAFVTGETGEPAAPTARARRLEERLEAMLSGDDADPFSTRTAPLVAAARNVLQDEGPLDGRAVISVYLDANGRVVRTERIAGSSAWDAVMERLRPRLKNTRAAVPKHSRGMRIDLELTIRDQRPSGADGRKSTVRMDKLTLVPRLGGSFDLSDLSGITQRIASVRVVSQTKL